MKKFMYPAIIILAGLFCVVCVHVVQPGDKTLATAREHSPVVYSGVRIQKMPIAVQTWSYRKFTFFETLKRLKKLGIKYAQAYPGQTLCKSHPGIRFNHALSPEFRKMVKKELKTNGVQLVGYGVVDFQDTEESMKTVFGFAREFGIRTIIHEPKYRDLTRLQRMVDEYGIKIAIHNHPPPTKYANPEAVLKISKRTGERIGSCADIGHWMRGHNVPVEALRMLKGSIHDVHLKDRNRFGTEGAHDVPIGTGKANIRDVLAELTLQDYRGYLVIEHEIEEEVHNPEPAIKKAIDYIRSVTYYNDYEEILAFSWGEYRKHGWNHYGPGYFKLNPKTGVLKSQGGMGLLWYGVRMYKDFVLELDYKCSTKETNSGVFVRIPFLPVSNDYIYHSFEIQINDAGEGIHKTAAAYDAAAPTKDTFYPAGQWNHMKITCRGRHLMVELNGELVLDWQAEPRGKVKDFAEKGYIGLQNHDSRSPVFFRRIYIKEL
jgi:sugar phosphate isomerase/epimerase